MTDGTVAQSDEITINVKGPSELKLQIAIQPSKTVTELKEAIAAKCDVEKDRQRLIYSGKVLKDEDQISNYKIQTGHTIHMVKGAAKSAGSTTTSSSGSTSAAQAPRLPQMGTGLNVAGNPVDNVENIHHGLAGFNPFAGMQGMDNLYDPNAMASMMQNPEFLRSMSEMMSRPEIVDQIVATNPQLAGMGPQIRQMMSNPMVRQMMSNPETMRMMMQMQSAMNQGGGGMGGLGGMGEMGGMGGMGGFPGMFGQQGTSAQQPPSDPFPNLFAPQATAPTATPGTDTATTGTGTGESRAPGSPPAAGSAPANPFAALFGPGGMYGMGGQMGQTPGQAGQAGQPQGQGQGQMPAFNPFAMNPAMFGGWPPAPAAPRDTRPPEEIYATQLGQLNAMGLWDAQKNITALRRTGGNVEAAIELIFSGSLD